MFLNKGRKCQIGQIGQKGCVFLMVDVVAGQSGEGLVSLEGRSGCRYHTMLWWHLWPFFPLVTSSKYPPPPTQTHTPLPPTSLRLCCSSALPPPPLPPRPFTCCTVHLSILMFSSLKSIRVSRKTYSHCNRAMWSLLLYWLKGTFRFFLKKSFLFHIVPLSGRELTEDFILCRVSAVLRGFSF